MECRIEKAGKRLEQDTYRRVKSLATEFVDWRIMGTEPDIYEAEYRTPEGDRLYVEGRVRGGEPIADSVDGVSDFFARGDELEPERARFYYGVEITFYRKRGAQMVRVSESVYRYGWGSPPARGSAMLPR